MKTLMDIYKEQADYNKMIANSLYDDAVAAHNGAVLGILPLKHKMEGRESLIEEETGAAE